MAELVITRKNGDQHTVLYDDADEALVQERRWCLGAGRPGSHYAVTCTGVLMHRHIMGMGRRADDPERREVDHINGNKLDNRRGNLRVVSHQENAWGYWPARSACGVRGVTWDKARSKWAVGVWRDGKRHSGGRYEDFAEACAAATELRARVFV